MVGLDDHFFGANVFRKLDIEIIYVNIFKLLKLDRNPSFT